MQGHHLNACCIHAGCTTTDAAKPNIPRLAAQLMATEPSIRGVSMVTVAIKLAPHAVYGFANVHRMVIFRSLQYYCSALQPYDSPLILSCMLNLLYVSILQLSATLQWSKFASISHCDSCHCNQHVIIFVTQFWNSNPTLTAKTPRHHLQGHRQMLSGAPLLTCHAGWSFVHDKVQCICPDSS